MPDETFTSVHFSRNQFYAMLSILRDRVLDKGDSTRTWTDVATDEVVTIEELFTKFSRLI